LAKPSDSTPTIAKLTYHSSLKGKSDDKAVLNQVDNLGRAQPHKKFDGKGVLNQVDNLGRAQPHNNSTSGCFANMIPVAKQPLLLKPLATLTPTRLMRL